MKRTIKNRSDNSFKVRPFGGRMFIDSEGCYTADISCFLASFDSSLGSLILRTLFLNFDSAFSKSTVSGSLSDL